ncbi:MAG: cobalt ECF transporter T component CbiQ, partial [Lachnospiraceae bacterium]|nr:cobalt ECF transporter T component CbiQ [Lachnospiraceae bacterium]
MIVIDKLCYYSRLRYINAGEKFAFATITLLFCVISRSILMALLVLAVNGILTVKKGKIPFSRYWHLMTIPMVFLFLSTLAILLNFSHTPFDAFAIPLGRWYLTASYASLYEGCQLILTALASVSCLYFLSLNTPITDILEVLKKLHCPDLIIELMLLIYRFIFILMDVSSAISTSQDARLGNKDIKTSY